MPLFFHFLHGQGARHHHVPGFLSVLFAGHFKLGVSSESVPLGAWRLTLQARWFTLQEYGFRPESVPSLRVFSVLDAGEVRCNEARDGRVAREREGGREGESCLLREQLFWVF